MAGRRLSTGFATPLGPLSGGTSPVLGADPGPVSTYRPDIGISMNDGDYAANQAQAGQQAQADVEAAGQRSRDAAYNDHLRYRALDTQDRDRANAQSTLAVDDGNGGYTSGNAATRGGTIRVPSLPPPVPARPSMKNMNSAIASVKGLMTDASQRPTYGAPEDPGSKSANDLAYAGAKDRIGRERLNAVRSFQGVMDSRGLTGSTGRGFESGGVGSIIGSGLDELGDVALDQAQDTIGRNREVYDRDVAAQERRRQMALGGLMDLYRQMGLM